MPAITISCSGDKSFRTKLKLLSLKEGKTMANLVRKAIDHMYGETLSTLDDDVSFFNQDGDKKHQLVNNKTKGEQS